MYVLAPGMVYLDMRPQSPKLEALASNNLEFTFMHKSHFRAALIVCCPARVFGMLLFTVFTSPERPNHVPSEELGDSSTVRLVWITFSEKRVGNVTVAYVKKFCTNSCRAAPHHAWPWKDACRVLEQDKEQLQKP